ncbi:phage integrase N-terminal SAM-like domain-containing protein [Photobacterium leiognathi subsp. mandapamensis]|uniref:phage integrase N-terminal SAM-like domain-containing protein n=1 Tax=Photobacterium leiognathi TaxID=553611 RepID=UPI003AF33CC3
MNKAQQHRSGYLYERHLTHLTMQGKRPATIDTYSRALRRIIHQLNKSPDTLTKVTTHHKDNARLLFDITLHDISNIYLYKKARACSTLR